MLVTALAPQGRLRQGRPDSPHGACRAQRLREAALKLGYLTGEEFDQLVKPERMTRP